jgi:hypothetical protein
VDGGEARLLPAFSSFVRYRHPYQISLIYIISATRTTNIMCGESLANVEACASSNIIHGYI